MKMYKIKNITNKIIYGDNLERMKLIPDESIDLIYLDPPFFSDFDYESFWGDEHKNKNWDEVYKEDGTRTGGMENYIQFMWKRLDECHRILKSTGTIFLHCDKHANHRLRLLLDEIFGANKFLNEIIWYYPSMSAARKHFPQKHDNIYWYAKGNNWVFNYDDVRVPYATSTIARGKYGGAGFTRKEGKAGYLDKDGKISPDVWQIPHLKGKERLGYKTQKPEALLERIVLAASNEGDLVLDPFCGCGTTIAVAKRLNRRFIGIDWSEKACRVMEERLGNSVSDILELPKTLKDFDGMDGFLFQKWMCFYLGAKSNPKERGDKGIDGWFPDGTLLQTKMGRVGPKIVNEFSSVIQRHGKNGKGVIASYAGFTRGAERAMADIARKLEIVIILITTEDVLKKDFDRFEDVVGHKRIEETVGVRKWYWQVPKGKRGPIKDVSIQETLVFLTNGEKV